MGRLGTSKLDLEEIKNLHFQGKTDKEIAVVLNYSPSSVAYVRRNILKLGTVYEDISISKEQEEILLGTLLGDSYIGYTHNRCRFPNITFSHCKKQELYAKTKFNKLMLSLVKYFIKLLYSIMLLFTIKALLNIFAKLFISHDLIATRQLFIIFIEVIEENNSIFFSTNDSLTA